jgi:Raf kinase inhibitor-like YbhB/YbcL family protein
MAFALMSSSFGQGDQIPAAHTCDGDGISPPLAWTDVPHDVKSLVLMVEDPDASSPTGGGRPFLHWIVYNVQPSSPGIPLGAARGQDLPPGSIQGLNDADQIGYFPPRPPRGTHRYVFRLFALDSTLPERRGLTRDEVQAAMTGHVLAETDLTGVYARQQDVTREAQSPR